MNNKATENRKRSYFAKMASAFVLGFSLLSLPAFAENELSVQALEIAANKAQMQADIAGHPELTPLHVLAQLLSKADDVELNIVSYYFRTTMKISDQVIGTAAEQVQRELNKLNKTRHPNATLDSAKWKEFQEHMQKMMNGLGRKAGVQEFLGACLELSHVDYMKPGVKHLADLGVDRAKLEVGSDLDKVDPLKGLQVLYENERGIEEMSWGRHRPELFRGRLSEVEDLLEAIAYGDKIPVLEGNVGSGKTSVVEEVARRIQQGDASVPPNLLASRPQIVRIDMRQIYAAANGEGKGILDRFDRAMVQARKDPSAIIFVDNLGIVKGIKNQGADSPLSVIFAKLASSVGSNKIIAAGVSVSTEFGKEEVRSAFRVHELFAPDRATDLFSILDSHRISLEEEHKITIPDDLIPEIVRLTSRYITSEAQPASSIQLMREAALMLRKEQRERARPGAVPVALQKYRDRLERFYSEWKKLSAIPVDDLTGRDRKKREYIQKEMAELQRSIGQLDDDWKNGKILLEELALLRKNPDADKDTLEIKEAELRAIQTRSHFHYEKLDLYHLAYRLFERTRVPLNGILGTMQDRIGNVEEFFSSRLIGQPEALAQTVKIQKRLASGFQDSNRPSVSFYTGSTGTGKTYLSKLEAEFMFGDPDAMFRLDMAEFSQDVDVNKIKGTAPGYVGFENPLPFVEHIKKNPYSIILLDEIEKAAPSFFNLLHGILEDGHFRDSQGNEIDCRNLRFVMTSNLGATTLQRAWDEIDEPDPVKKYQTIQELAKKIMQFGDPEKGPGSFTLPTAIVGRIKLSDIIVFRNLSPEDMGKIFALELKKWEADREALKEADFILTDRARQKITDVVIERGSEFGARGIRDLISGTLEDPLSELKTNKETAPAVQKHGRMRIDFDEVNGVFVADVPKTLEKDCPDSFARLSKTFGVPPAPPKDDGGPSAITRDPSGPPAPQPQMQSVADGEGI